MNSTQQYEYKLSIIYFSFRTLLAVSLGGISIADRNLALHGRYESTEFLAGVILYFSICMLNLLYTSFVNTPPQRKTTFAAILVDISFCIVFMHLCGGFRTGLAILLLAPITIGSIFFHGSAAFFLAAVGIVGMLLDTLYQASLNIEESKYFVPAGLVGILFFATSMITQAVARHLRTTEARVWETVEKARGLEKLNESIVQRMLTGIIVITADNRIQLSNDIAKDLLGFPLLPNGDIEGRLREQLLAWKQDPEVLIEPFRDRPGLPIIKASFSMIDKLTTIIFIENQSALNQQAQHIKLSSLGRLSASIAHEIRNPLNAISHASQLLLESPDIPEADLRLLDMINNHTKRINGIINNVLDISRRAPTLPEKVNVTTLLERLQTSLPASASAAVEVEIPDDFTVSFDESQLSQVLFNLIDNALRHSEEATGQRWVRIEAGNRNDRPEIAIFDRGHGIRPEDVEKVFEPFYTTHKAGTGLGLYVARELCEMNQAILDYLYDENGRGYFSIRFAHLRKNISPS